MTPFGTHLALALGFAALVAACGGDDDSGGSLSKGGTGGKGSTGSGGSTPIDVTGGSSGTSGTAAGGGANATASGGSGPYMLPAGYTRADDGGGWKLGDPVVAGEPPPDTTLGGTMGCGQEILGIVRDFRRGDKGGHPDFNTFTGQGEEGAVMATLGDDQKPVFNPAVLNDAKAPCKADAGGAQGSCFTSQDNYDTWYRDVPGDDPDSNRPYYVFFSLEPNNGKATFHSNGFFPLDGKGFENEGDDHNFSFTTEVHTTFLYSGGENFQFTGDDDLWVFINNKLAIDLGGLHSKLNKNVLLDEQATKLGIKKGEIYPLDLFHAERHTNESNFAIETTLYFVDCGVIVPSGPVK